MTAPLPKQSHMSELTTSMEMAALPKHTNEEADIVPLDGETSYPTSADIDQKTEHDGQIEHSQLEYEAVRSAWDDLTYRQTVRIFWKGIAVCFLAAFSAFTDGYQIAMVGNIIAFDGFIKQFSTQNDPVTGAPILAAGVLSAWNAVGSVMQWCGMNIFPFIADRFGRRWCMISYWLVIAAGCACENAAREWRVWLLAKMFVGLGVGAMQFAMQTYLTEMSPTSKIRGAILSTYNFWWVTGLFIGTVVITILHQHDSNNWLLIVYSQWSQVAVMGIIYVFCLPESPWWYARQGKHEQGVKVLRKLYGSIAGYHPEEEYDIVRRTIEHERAYAKSVKEIPYLAIFRGVNGWRTFVSCYELTVASFVGQSFLSTYVVYFFEIAGSTDAFANTCITSALGIVCTVFLMFGLDVCGRRRLITYGITTMWFSLFLIGCISLAPQTKALNGLLIFLACTWTISFNLANGAGWPLVGEVSSSRLRAPTAGFAASVSVAFGIGLGYGTPYMISTADLNWGLKTCFFFAGLSVPFVIGLWFVIPETTGRSAAELDEMFEAKVKPWRFRKHVTEVQRLRTAAKTGQQEIVMRND